MKRQAICISLEDLKRIKKRLKKELKNIEKLGLTIDKEKMGFKLDIINYPTQFGNKVKYCSDTWEFEMLRTEKNVKPE